MVNGWTNWSFYPVAERDDAIKAPVGPGVYEVRRVSNGHLVAFGHTGNVAQALSRVAPTSQPIWATLIGRAVTPRRDLEYRTCTAASKAQARMMAERLIGRRQVYWRRSLLTGGSAA